MMMRFDLQRFSTALGITIEDTATTSAVALTAEEKYIYADANDGNKLKITADSDTAGTALVGTVDSDKKTITLSAPTTGFKFSAGLAGYTFSTTSSTATFAVGTAWTAKSISFGTAATTITAAEGLVIAADTTFASSSDIEVTDKTNTNSTVTVNGKLIVVEAALKTGAGATIITDMEAGAKVSGLVATAKATTKTTATTNGKVTINDSEMTVSQVAAGALTFTAANTGVSGVEGLAVGDSISGVTTGATVTMAAGMAQGKTVSVNGTSFAGGSKTDTANQLLFKISATGANKVFLTGGTIMLNAGESAYTIADVSDSAATSDVKAEKGDITITVADSNKTVTVSDLDNGDSFTINSNTFTVVNGQVVNVTTGAYKSDVLLNSANSSEKTIQLVINTAAGYTTGTATAVDQILPSTGDAFTTPDITDGGTGMTVTDVDGNNRVVASFANGQYLHKDGTITSDSTNAIASLSYNDSTDVATYTATSSKAQTIDLTNSTLVWDVTATTAGDTMTGNNKNTTLSGGAGKDTLTAGGATDVLVGGEGADMFDMTAGKVANISDFSLTDGDVLKTTVTAGTTPTMANLTLNAEGVAVVGTGSATIQSSGGFYGAKFGDAKGENGQIVAWVGENATTIDNSGTNFKNVILVGTTNENGDNLVGGSSKDTLYGGANDTLAGGEGKDTYVLTAADAGQIVSISTTSGKDTVTSGFTKGFDLTESDGLNVTAGSTADINVTYDGTNAIVEAGDSASVQINSLTADTTTKTVDLNINGAKVAAIANNTVAKISEANYADWYLGTTASGIDFSGVDNNMEVNLGDSDHYRNIATLKGGSGNTTLMGGAKAESLVAGSGQTSLWGGTAGNDTLVSGKDATSFFYGTGNGKDVVTGFKMADANTSDVLTFIDGGFGSVSRTSASAFEVRMASGERLTVNQSVSGADKAVKWQLMDGTASGLAKFALANNRLTYDKDVTLYVGTSSKDTVSVASSADNASVWLDGSQGVTYSSIEVVDAKSTTGNATLAGGSGAETIYGGQGASSLWGGADTSNDVLVGSGKGTAMFFYGLGQGNDVINATTKDDTVNLFGVKLSDITATAVDSTKVTITTTANETLTVNGSVTKFTTGDGQTFYADHRNKAWSTTAV